MFFYHTNHINSSSVVTSVIGAVVTRIVYLPFGEISQVNSTGSDTVTNKFTGQEFDEDSGLYYYNARYYDPKIGRFLSPDSMIPNLRDAQSFNRYSYVGNNPIMYTDPSGNLWEDLFIDSSAGGEGSPSGTFLSAVKEVFGGGNTYGTGYVGQIESVSGSTGSSGDLSPSWGQSQTSYSPSINAYTGGSPSSRYSSGGYSPTPGMGSTAPSSNGPSGVGSPTSASSAGTIHDGLSNYHEPGLGRDYLLENILLGGPVGKAIAGLGGAAFRAVGLSFENMSTLAGKVLSNAAEGRLALPAASGYNPWVGAIRSEVTSTETTLFRVWGDEAGQVGGWATPTMPSSSLSAIRELALPPGNSAQWVSEIAVPAGTRLQIGTAAEVFGQPGGAPQVLLLDWIPQSCFGPGIPLGPR
jgi:RHS repeat-associated protein